MKTLKYILIFLMCFAAFDTFMVMLYQGFVPRLFFGSVGGFCLFYLAYTYVSRKIYDKRGFEKAKEAMLSSKEFKELPENVKKQALEKLQQQFRSKDGR